MKKLLICSIIALSGCATVTPKHPQVVVYWNSDKAKSTEVQHGRDMLECEYEAEKTRQMPQYQNYQSFIPTGNFNANMAQIHNRDDIESANTHAQIAADMNVGHVQWLCMKIKGWESKWSEDWNDINRCHGNGESCLIDVKK